ncbi:hypothetical protein N9M83_04590 [Candidatus Poseidonia alphae]|nr:hypothetical protein [Candidatus Poseidonia alphae]MDA8759492.1 hypothetical protein [Candidatus Poseidonia alphae]MDA8838999.1 hypothetical protein [Candidatus Poseidonia alphae]
MQSDSPWDDITPESEMKDSPLMDEAPETIPISAGFSTMQNGAMLSGMAEMPPGQMIFLGPPSSAPKVVGILCVLWGVFDFGSSGLNLLGVVGNQTSQPLLFAVYFGGLAVGIATVAGGVMLVSYQRRGVQLLFGAILVGSVLNGLELTMMDEIYDQMLDDGDLTQEEYDVISASSGLVAGIGMFFVALCGGMCALIAAIPLMVSNNGLDKSSLFG